MTPDQETPPGPRPNSALTQMIRSWIASTVAWRIRNNNWMFTFINFFTASCQRLSTPSQQKFLCICNGYVPPVSTIRHSISRSFTSVAASSVSESAGMTERRPSAMPLFKNSRRPASVNVCSFIAYHPRQVIPVRSRRKRCCHKRCLTFIQLFRATTGSSSTSVLRLTALDK